MRNFIIVFAILVFLAYCYKANRNYTKIYTPEYKTVELNVLKGYSRHEWNTRLSDLKKDTYLAELEAQHYEPLADGIIENTATDKKHPFTPYKHLTAKDFRQIIEAEPGRLIKLRLRDASQIYNDAAKNLKIRNPLNDIVGLEDVPKEAIQPGAKLTKELLQKLAESREIWWSKEQERREIKEELKILSGLRKFYEKQRDHESLQTVVEPREKAAAKKMQDIRDFAKGKRYAPEMIGAIGIGMPISVQLGTMLMLVLIFLALVAALKTILWEPVSAILDKRNAKIDLGRELRRQNQKDNLTIDSEIQRKRAEMRRVYLSKVSHVQREAQKDADHIVRQARAEVFNMRVNSEAETIKMIAKIEEELQKEVPELAKDVVSKVLKQSENKAG